MSALPDTTAVILAGGFGIRLRSVVADRPKVLAPIHQRPFLTYLLDQLVHHQVRRVVLCTGHLGDQVQAQFGTAYRGLRLFYSREHQPLGTGGALRHACRLFESDSVLVQNGDSFCDCNVDAFARAHHQSGARATLLLAHQEDTARFGQVQIDDQSRITSFTEKGHTTPPGWINAGIYLVSAALLTELPEGRKVSLEREVFPTWIGRGLFGHPTHDTFLDIGTPESYGAAEHFFAARGCA